VISILADATLQRPTYDDAETILILAIRALILAVSRSLDVRIARAERWGCGYQSKARAEENGELHSECEMVLVSAGVAVQGSCALEVNSEKVQVECIVY
jgi:hypothetical protein